MANEEQARLWNGPAGGNWVEAQQLLDDMFRPFEDILARAVSDTGASRVLDVGCGTGATTLAAAQVIGTPGACTGVDISQPMIELARTRAARAGIDARFIVADAQTHDFTGADYDLLISRFGVMFFADAARAFGNLRRGARPGAGLRFLAFRSMAENPFMTAAERAVASLLPDLPPRLPDGPGQFAFADADKVRGLLTGSGWEHVEIQPIDVICSMAERDLDGYLARLGPVSLALRNADEATRARALPLLRAAFTPYLQGAEVRFTAACWEISAATS